MNEKPTEQQQHELDRALLGEHGPSYIETICSFAGGMRTKGRTADADDALRQCARMRAMLLSDKDLVAAFKHTDGDDSEARNLLAGIERRELDF